MPSTSLLRELPIVVAGAGPAGSTVAVGLQRAGIEVLGFEARGPLATRARNIFLRPHAREIFAEIAGFDPGRDSTIMNLENSLRDVARREQVPIAYNERVVDLIEHADHITVRVQRDGSDVVRDIQASMLVDATGGRLPAANTGELERVATGAPHFYVTAQYDTPARHPGVYGAFDRGRSEVMLTYPVNEGRGFITYYDLPPGMMVDDEAAMAAHYDMLAERLEFGTPVNPPQVFNAQQHLAQSAASGHIIKVGDSGGNADPYIGAGVAAALIDAKAAIHALTTPGDRLALMRGASEDIVAGHRSLIRQAKVMIELRNLAMRTLPKASFDEMLKPSDLGTAPSLDAVAGFLTTRPIRLIRS